MKEKKINEAEDLIKHLSDVKWFSAIVIKSVQVSADSKFYF